LGGDEFGLLLSQEVGEDGAIALERVRQLIDQPYFLAGREIQMSASIGYTVFPKDDVKVGDLVRHADKAMYRAKHDGGDKVCLYS
jgi:diguanylate cyclase (GGDEF)-like protein